MSIARPDGNHRYFFKFAQCLKGHMAMIRQAFPEVPWIFIHRDPHEVMASNLGRHGGWMIQKYDMNETLKQLVTFEEWVVERLAEVVQEAVDQTPNKLGMFVDYTVLKESMLGPVARHFQLNLTDADKEKMLASVRVHSKFGDRKTSKLYQAEFSQSEDSSAKRANITAEVRASVGKYFGDEQHPGLYRSVLSLSSIPDSGDTQVGHGEL